MTNKKVHLTKRSEEILSMFMDRRMFKTQAQLIEKALEDLLETTVNEQKANNKDEVDESEKERFIRITSRVDNLAKKGWELSDDKINGMTSSILEEK